MLAVLTYRFVYLYRWPAATVTNPVAGLKNPSLPEQNTSAPGQNAAAPGQNATAPHVITGWQEIVTSPPEVIDFPSLLQAEALTFDFSGQSLFLSSEFSHAPLLRIDQSKLRPVNQP